MYSLVGARTLPVTQIEKDPSATSVAHEMTVEEAADCARPPITPFYPLPPCIPHKLAFFRGSVVQLPPQLPPNLVQLDDAGVLFLECRVYEGGTKGGGGGEEGDKGGIGSA